MDWWQALVLGIVEGVTEYLPVSSTGHLILAQRAMGIEGGEAADAYAICIQGGAILAVLMLYWRRLWGMVAGVLGGREKGPPVGGATSMRAGRGLAVNLVAALAPLLVVVLLEKLIKEHLFGLWPVTVAWVVGGLAILLVAKWAQRHVGGRELETLTWRMALVIGLAQCVAVWPGTSRSLVTILAGLLVGLNLRSAVEFSFLLGVFTLGAATVKDAAEYHEVMLRDYGLGVMALGFIAAFVSAVIAVKWMVSYLQRHSLAVFGWYRLGLGALVAALLLMGQLRP